MQLLSYCCERRRWLVIKHNTYMMRIEARFAKALDGMDVILLLWMYLLWINITKYNHMRLTHKETSADKPSNVPATIEVITLAERYLS